MQPSHRVCKKMATRWQQFHFLNVEKTKQGLIMCAHWYRLQARGPLFRRVFEDLVDAVLGIVLELHAREEEKLGQHKGQTDP